MKYNAENSLRKKPAYTKPKEELKFCIGKCEREFIPKDNMIQIYCPSCDRVLVTRPINNFNKPFKDV